MHWYAALYIIRPFIGLILHQKWVPKVHGLMYVNSPETVVLTAPSPILKS